jgi:hypothetical protein
MKFNKSKATIKGVFGDGDEPTIEQKIISKLGVDADAIAKIQAGELDVDTYAKTYFSNYESNLKSRLMPELESSAMSEAFGKAYGKAEKTILDTFGLDAQKYAEIDKKDRFSTIVSDIKKLQEEKINGFQSADAQKLAQLTQQLEQANALVRQKELEAEERINALKSEYTQKEHAAIVSKKENDLINGFENSRFGAKEMRFMLRGYMNENGFGTEIDQDGNIWIVKNGTRVPNPNRQTENLKLETMFEIVSNEFEFKKKSNGGERPAGAFKLEGNPNFDKMPPQFKKYMQENGLM